MVKNQTKPKTSIVGPLNHFFIVDVLFVTLYLLVLLFGALMVKCQSFNLFVD